MRSIIFISFLFLLNVTNAAKMELTTETKSCMQNRNEDVKVLQSCKTLEFAAAAGPGGGSDTVIRQISEMMAAFNIAVVVNNKPSVNGQIAAVDISKDPNPCHFVVASNSNLSLNYFNKNYKPSINPSGDLRPVSLLTTTPLVLAVKIERDGVKIPDYASFKAMSKKYSLFYSSPGVGSLSHLLATQLETLWNPDKISLSDRIEQARNFDTHVPYRDSGTASVGLNSNQVNYLFESPSTIYKSWSAGKNKILILGNTSDKEIKYKELRIPPIKDNDSELLKDFKANGYVGIFASKNYSPRNRDVNSALENVNGCLMADKNFRQKYEDLGFNVSDGSTKSLNTELADYDVNGKWAKAYQRMEEMQLRHDKAVEITKPDDPQAKPASKN